MFALAFAHDGETLASAGREAWVVLWNLKKAFASLEKTDALLKMGHKQAIGNFGDAHELSWGTEFPGVVQALAFSPSDDTLVAGCMDSRLCTWDAANRRLLRSRQGHSPRNPGTKQAEFDSFKGTTAVAFSPDGSIVVSGGSDRRLRLWQSTKAAERRFGNP